MRYHLISKWYITNFQGSWFISMTKAPIATENTKKQSDNTKTSITKGFQTTWDGQLEYRQPTGVVKPV